MRNYITFFNTGFIPIAILFLWVSVVPLACASDDVQLRNRWVKAIANDDGSRLTELLLSSGAPDKLVSLRAETGKTAFMIACKLGDRALADQLLARGADVNAVTKTGGTPFMFASLGGHVEFVRFLSTRGVDVNAQGANGWSATTIAAAKGYAELLAVLVGLGTDINVRDVYLWTPLMRSVDNRHSEAASVLLAEESVELDAQDEAGNTALHHAAANGDVINLRQLLEKGADKEIKNTSGYLPAQLAAASPNAELASGVLLSD